MSDVEYSQSYALAKSTCALPQASPGAYPRATAADIIGLRDVPTSTRTILLALTQVTGGELVLGLPDGRRLRFGDAGAPSATMRISSHNCAKRVLARGDIGFAEGWIENEWTSPDLAALLTLLAANAERFMRVFRGGPIGQALNWLAHLSHANTRSGARRNILAHYDLGNSFFEAWLDPSMTYSAARFDLAHGLEQAQQAKYRALAGRLALKPGEHVLEIGCGWGGFAEIAAREYGARVTAITISDEQLQYARARMQRANLDDRVEVRRQDYRDVEGQFDKIASIEMFEAVGEEHWPLFFGKLAGALKPGGCVAMQVITVRDDLFDDYRRRADFIQRHIFPGGKLPSMARLSQEAQRAGLMASGIEAFGGSYAETLAEWARRFHAKWEVIAPMGFDERFKRLWQFYLSYCQAGFRTGRTDVVQLTLAQAKMRAGDGRPSLTP